MNKRRKKPAILLAMGMALAIIATSALNGTLSGKPFSAITLAEDNGCSHAHGDCSYTEAMPCRHAHDKGCGYSEASPCTHHHEVTCGYVAASPCGHAHNGSCGFSEAVACHHAHDGACGWAAASPCGHVHGEACGEGGADCAHVHDGSCGWAAASPCGHAHDGACGWAAASPCGHAHDGACGYAEAAPCQHAHDGACGYAEASPCCHTHDVACGYVEAAACDHVCDAKCGGLPATEPEDEPDPEPEEGEEEDTDETCTPAASLTFTIIGGGEYGNALYLPQGQPVTDGDLLAGVSAMDENGETVAVTVQSADGLDRGNPQPREGFLPYTIAYGAAHPVTGEVFTATLEAYVTVGIMALAEADEYSILGLVSVEDYNYIGFEILANVTVELWKDGSQAGSTSSGSDGTFAFNGLIDGVYTVTVPAGTYDSKYVLQNDETVTINGGDQHLTIYLTEDNAPGTYSVSGRVRQGISNYMSNVPVELWHNGSLLRSTTSGPMGSYAFYSLANGEYTIKTPGITYSYNGNYYPETSQTVTINGGDDFVYVTLAEGNVPGTYAISDGRILEYVTDAYLKDVRIVLYDSAYQIVASALSGPDGRFTFWSIPDGLYTLRIPAGLYGGKYYEESIESVAIQGEDLKYLRIHLSPGAAPVGRTISGKVIENISGMHVPVSGATVLLYADDGSQIAITASSSNGDYSFSGLDSGDYVVFVPAGTYNGVSYEETDYETYVGWYDEIVYLNLIRTGAAGTTVTLLNILGIPPPVTGETPVYAVTETEQYTGTVTWSPNHNPFSQDNVFTATIKLYTKPGFTMLGVSANSFTVTGATSVSNPADIGEITAQFPVTLGNHTISGRVLTNFGLNELIPMVGLNGVTIELYHASDAATPIATTNSGENPLGSYSFVNLPIGSYIVKVPAGNYAGMDFLEASEPVTVSTFEIPTLDIILKPATTQFYNISLNPYGNQTFTAVEYGYSPIAERAITIMNTGELPTGSLTLALSGTGASNFTLSKAGFSDLAAGGNDTFSVKPNDGLNAGTYVATVTVSGGNGISQSFDVSFSVNKANQTLTVADIDKTVGGGSVDLSGHAVSTAGANSGVITYAVADAGTTGASLSGTTLSFTSVGAATLTATAAGSANYDGATTTFTLTVTAATVAPTITSANSTSVVNGTGGTFQVTATGTTPINYSLTGAPADVGINGTSGLITIAGTVAANTYTFTITASNGTLPDATQNLTLMVTAATIAPTITSANSTSVITGTGGTFQVNATGTTPINYSLTGAPAGVGINGTSGLISIAGTVPANTYTFTITAGNGSLPDATQSFTLTVTAATIAPTITSANSTSVVAGTGGMFQVNATGTTPISYSLSGASAGVTINGTNGLITVAGTVPANTYTFTVMASNGTFPDATQSFTLTVTAAGVATYTLTVTNGAGSGTYAAGATITIVANTPPAGQRFKAWVVNSGGVTLGNPLAASTSFVMPARAVTVAATYEPLPVIYTITVQNDGHGTASANVNSAAQGVTISLTATPNSGYRFKEWQVINGGVTITNHQFIMPAQNVTVKAIFENLPVPTVTPTPAPAATATPTATSTAAVTPTPSPTTIIPDTQTPLAGPYSTTAGEAPTDPLSVIAPLAANINPDGWLYITIDELLAGGAIDYANSEADRIAITQNGVAVTFETDAEWTAGFSCTLTAEALALLEAEGVKSLTVRSGPFWYSFDLAAVASLTGQSGGSDITIVVTPATGLSEGFAALIDGRAVFNVSTTYMLGDTAQRIADLDDGLMTLGIAYQSRNGESVANVKAITQDADGAPWIVPESEYSTDWVTWADTRCSMTCGVGYQE